MTLRMFVCLLCCPMSILFATTLETTRMMTDHKGVHIILTCSDRVAYRMFTLSHPERVVIDLPHTRTGLRHVIPKSSLGDIRHLRVGIPRPNTLRLVFEMFYLKKPTVYWTQHQLHIIFPASQRTMVPASLPLRTLQRMVVIDPGHGGHDPGAMGPDHQIEKNITLGIAIKLRDLINHQSGMRAILTRDRDEFIELRQRLRMARQHHADVFISIHADAFIQKNAHGASIFALSSQGATSEAAKWLADKENHSELGGVNLNYLNDKNGMIRSVLLDLSQTATIRASLALGHDILKALGQVTRLHNRHVEQAPFVVLKSPDTPSILIETGFISHPEEGRRLATAAYQKQLASAIFQGLHAYFKAHAPFSSRP